MKLGLLGYPIDHSKSPELYRRFLGKDLISYELFSYPTSEEIPSLSYFSQRLDGLNITSPYKKHFVGQVEIPSPLVRSLGAINTLAFTEHRTFGTNTDLVAIVNILQKYQNDYGPLHILLLGDGVMSFVTRIVALDLGIPFMQFSRKLTADFQQLDLSRFELHETQALIINSCSRDYVFNGHVSGKEIFWDYNYSFLPHQKTLPLRVKAYHDGQEMLELQAKAAIDFWNAHKA